MASIYNTRTAQVNRAKILALTALQPRSDIAAIAKSTDALLLVLGGMDKVHGEVYEESGFIIRTQQAAAAGLPVLAQFNVDARYYLDHQADLASVTNLVTEVNNKPVQKIIEVLGAAGPIHAIVLNLTNYQTAGSQITDVWQQATLQSVFFPLKNLMDQGRLKKVPIIILTYPAFLLLYQAQLLNWLYNRRGETAVALYQYIYDPTPGPSLESLQVLWDTYRPAEDFKFLATPYGYQGMPGDGLIVFHIYTSDRFAVPEVTDSAGTHERVTCALFCDTQGALDTFLNFTRSGTPPPPPPPPPPSTNEARLAALEQGMAELSKSTTRLDQALNAAIEHVAALLEYYRGLK